MGGFLTKVRFPTLLGLTLLILGLGSGVFLTVQNQTLTSQAAPDQTPVDVRVTNIESDTVTISWRTNSEVTGFVNYFSDQFDGKVGLDIRDKDDPTIARNLHYVVLKNLTPSTTYKYKIVSGRLDNLPEEQFTTASQLQAQSDSKPIIGNVVDDTNPLENGVIYLEIPGAIPQSALVKNYGSFIIPTSSIRTEDLSVIFTPADEEVKITAYTNDNRHGSVTFKLSADNQLTQPIRIGEDQLYVQDGFGAEETLGISTFGEIGSRFDLNGDGRVNNLDYSYLIQNIGKALKDKRVDLNSDGRVDKKDQDLITEEINKITNR